ncbi:SCP-like protein [Ancylostoma caninum]|uniref:SCP-like protein n=1 Tax=Ancylostoma caninum TaxID=29170 RepID=A0A368H465_ANCCA|nr:SCP-like protein [Ancylostoma caninum]
MLLALLTALAVSELPYASSQACQGGVMNQTYIDSHINKINTYRTKLIKGEQENGVTGAMLPKGKNINKIAWSCDLELAAIKAVGGKCVTMKPATPSGNTDFFASYQDPDYYDTSIMLDIWLDEINAHSFHNVTAMDSVKYDNEQLRNYANLVRGTTTSFGCVEMKCATENLFTAYCLTNQAELQKDGVVYEVGNGTCTQDSDCTGGATCDTGSGLCVPAATTTSAAAGTTTTPASTVATTTIGSTTTIATTTAGGGGGVLPSPAPGKDNLQFSINTCYFCRAELAKGNIAKKNGNLLPKGADMSRLRYNCGLEAAVAQFVQQCPTATSPESSRAGLGENFFRRNGLADYSAAVHKAVTSWWKVVRQVNGIGMAVTFRQQHLSSPIVSFTQMAWAKTRKMGCAIAKCSSDYVVACRYSPRGNQVDQVVYARGNPCTACASGAWCTEGALCTLP